MTFFFVEAATASWVPWNPPLIFSILSRPVKALAVRMANMVASVPELRKRTLSNPGTRWQSSFASLNWLSVGVEY